MNLHTCVDWVTRTYVSVSISSYLLYFYVCLQVILQHRSQETEQTVKSAIRLNYIETASSILHEMPWVVVKEYKVCTYVYT